MTAATKLLPTTLPILVSARHDPYLSPSRWTDHASCGNTTRHIFEDRNTLLQHKIRDMRDCQRLVEQSNAHHYQCSAALFQYPR